MTQEIVIDDEDQMSQALAEIRADRSEDQSSSIEVVQPDAFQSTESATTQDAEPAQTLAPVVDPSETLKQVQAELHKARSEIGRVGALNQKFMQASQENAHLREELAQVRQSKTQTDSTETVSKLAQVAEQVKDFPELAGIVAAVSDALKQSDMKTEEVARRVASQMVEPLEPLRREQESRRENEYSAAQDAAMSTFNSTYPTAVKVVQSEEFKQWLQVQPGNVQYAFEKGKTPAEAMTVLDTYDMHLRRNGLTPIAQFNSNAPQTTKQSPNQNRLERAAGLPSRSNGSNGSAPPSDDFDASLAYFRNKRLAAQRTNT